MVQGAQVGPINAHPNAFMCVWVLVSGVPNYYYQGSITAKEVLVCGVDVDC